MSPASSQMASCNNQLLPPNIMNEVRKFISGAVRRSNKVDLTKTALYLITNVPAARDAILEHFCSVFCTLVDQYEHETNSNQSIPILEENIVLDIHNVISNFIESNPLSWSPTISKWAFDLLGKISSENNCNIKSKQKNDNPKSKQKNDNPNIHDCIQHWMACQATRTLIDLTTQCLRSTMNFDAETCITTLWDASVLHRPNFDWIVAHIGSCFPDIVITKILHCGLKDFAKLEFINYRIQKIDLKLNSVVGILSYLAGSHFYNVRSALLNLFMWSLDDVVTNSQEPRTHKIATIPFLLNLASVSPILSKVLISDISQILKPEVIPKLILFSPEWIKYFNNNYKDLINSIVHIALGCDQGALQIVNILLDTSINARYINCQSTRETKNVINVCREILELILEEIEVLYRKSDNSQIVDVPFLISIKEDINALISLLLNEEPLKIKTAIKLLSLLGTHNLNILISSASYMLQNATTNFQLGTLIKLFDENINFFSRKYKNGSCISNNGYFSQVIEQAIREVCYSQVNDEIATRKLFQNIGIVLKWENVEVTHRSSTLRSRFISLAVKQNLQQISGLLIKAVNFYLASDIIELFSHLNLVDDDNFSLNVKLTLRLTRAVVHYFFMCIAEQDAIMKQRGLKIVCQFLKTLASTSQYAKMLAIRELLEFALCNDQAKYFGAKDNLATLTNDVLLLQQNHKQGTGTILAQKHSSVFHAGVIGQGPRKFSTCEFIDQDVIVLNNTLLISAIKACCTSGEPNHYYIDNNALTMVSLILVELISPDVMYNGLPWPDEDFVKVTVERDLHIRRVFKDMPVLWTLLQLTAWYRPALAYCSVILRAIVATIMMNWNTSEGKLITKVMAMGQLLPSPLNSITDILDHLDNHQIMSVLRDCVWAYMHENVPSPMLFTKIDSTTNIAWRDSEIAVPNAKITNTLRLSLLSNIEKFGSLYACLFYKE